MYKQIKAKVSQSAKLSSTFRAFIIILVAAAILLSTAMVDINAVSYAGKTTAQMLVSVRVLTYLKVDVVNQTRVLVITEDDIKHGYLDVSEGTVLFVKTNTIENYNMYVETYTDIFKRVVIREGSRNVELPYGSGSASMTIPGDKYGEVLKISYSLHLNSNAQPGQYPWPFQVQVSL